MISEDTGRLQYEKRFHYNKKVLIGTWFEDLQRYVHNRHNHESSYSLDYVPKGKAYVHPNIVWENKIRAEGYGPRIIIDHERNKYHNNFSTTYDLAYRHFPKMNRPRLDYEANYGNVTEFGVRADKQAKWRSEVMDPPPTMATETQDAYQACDRTAYGNHRFASDRRKSAKILRVNQDFANLPLRGTRVSIPPDSLVNEQKVYTCPMYIKKLE